MAFIAMVIVGIFGVICVIFLFLMLLFLILGIVKARKKKKSAKVFFSLAAVSFVLLLGFLWFLFGPKRAEIDTPDGTVKVSKKITAELEECIENEDIQKLDEMLDKRPELVYYTNSKHHGMLYTAALTGNVELLECVLEHGAKFDDEILHKNLIYEYSLEYYFHNLTHLTEEETEKVKSRGSAPIVEIMLENGATVNFENNEEVPNALFIAIWWIVTDDEVTEDELQVVEMLIEHGASCTETNSDGDTILDVLHHMIEQYTVEDKDPEGIAKLEKMFEQAAK